MAKHFMKRPIRSAQAISPFGVGAMMDFPGPESLIQAGLDAWPHEVIRDVGRRISNEPRLANRLGVDFFLTPPPFDDEHSGVPPRLPWLRFPRWHSCPACGLMSEANLHDAEAPRCREHKGRPIVMQQIRFVAACRDGHLRDFPWFEWLVGNLKAEDSGEVQSSVDDLRALMKTQGARLKLKTTGEAGGQGILVQLVVPAANGIVEKVLFKRTMARAFGGDPNKETRLSELGVTCQGENPAIGVSPGGEGCATCDAPLLVVLRGAGNLYFADIESVIHIPDRIPGTLPDELYELFDQPGLVFSMLEHAAASSDGKLDVRYAKRELKKTHSWIKTSDEDLGAFVETFNKLEPFRSLTTSSSLLERLKQLTKFDALDDEALKEVLAKVTYEDDQIEEWSAAPGDLLARLRLFLAGQEIDAEEAGGLEELRQREFRVFSQHQDQVEGVPKSILKLRSREIGEYDELVSEHFEHVAILDTLRETRVLKGFNRLYARSRPLEDYRRLLWRKPPREQGRRWLPATVVYGEGIFLRFRTTKLEEWEQAYRQVHEGRLRQVEASMADVAAKRGSDPESVHPRRILIHTFAHLLINQLVFESGYGSSSLRERLYFNEGSGDEAGMAGLLIYTAAGDSEGSMGGLVRMGEPGRLGGVFRRALESALWCSSDPVCIESHGQGPHNCNLAACHSCALLPETSCEQQNRLLDRGVVVGTLTEPDSGYFSHCCR